MIITAHRSDTNPLAHHMRDRAVQSEIDRRRRSSRYRRLVYYFFEKEITTDIARELQDYYVNLDISLTDQETQALVARSSLSHQSLTSVEWYESMTILNDYILGQGVYEYDNADSDTLFAEHLGALLLSRQPQSEMNIQTMSTDVLLGCRQRRADVQIVSKLLNGGYQYRSLVQSCGEYLAEFGQLPVVLSYLGYERSTENFLLLLDHSTQISLQSLLLPQYELVRSKIPLSLPYGALEPHHTPYATVISRLGHRWSQQSRWLKVIVSIVIVIVSGMSGGWSLLILPLVRGCIQGALSARDRLRLLGQTLQERYLHYSDQHTYYISLYETMIDPDRSTQDTISSAHTMNHRYDVIPFAGHELLWEVSSVTQKLIDNYVSVLKHPQERDRLIQDYAQYRAVHDRSDHHHLLLWIVSNASLPEQGLYRLTSLLQLPFAIESSKSSGYQQTYETLDEVVSYKAAQFTSWTNFRALIDGSIVALSSGILGWLGAYLRNRGVFGQSAFASSSSPVFGSAVVSGTSSIDPIVDHALSTLLSDVQKSQLEQVILSQHQQDTVWETLVATLGYDKGNTVNAALMDTRRKVIDSQGQGELISKAVSHGLPLSTDSQAWDTLLGCLDHIYGYDNLVDYQHLIHQDRLPTTLQGLQDGTLSLSDIATLPQAQREILTQALFTRISKEDIVGLFMDDQVSLSIVGMGDITIESGGLIQTGDAVSSSGWFALLRSGWKQRRSSRGEHGSGNVTISGGGITGHQESLTGGQISGDIGSGTYSRGGLKDRLLSMFSRSSSASPIGDTITTGNVETTTGSARTQTGGWMIPHTDPSWFGTLGYKGFTHLYDFFVIGWSGATDFFTQGWKSFIGGGHHLPSFTLPLHRKHIKGPEQE